MARITTRGVTLSETPDSDAVTVQMGRLPRPRHFSANAAACAAAGRELIVSFTQQSVNEKIRSLVVSVPLEAVRESLSRVAGFIAGARKVAAALNVDIRPSEPVALPPDRTEFVSSNLISLSYADTGAEIGFYWVSPGDQASLQTKRFSPEDEVGFVYPQVLALLPIEQFMQLLFQMAGVIGFKEETENAVK